MPTGFISTEFEVTEENGVLVTVLGAPTIDEDDYYLMLQNKKPYTKQDIKLGMNKPYIEYCGQGWSWYGHIDSFELLRNRVRIKMDKEAADRMENDGLIEVDFALDENQFSQLQLALRRTFDECEFYIEQV